MLIVYALFSHIVVDRIEFSMDSKWNRVNGLCSISTYYCWSNWILTKCNHVDGLCSVSAYWLLIELNSQWILTITMLMVCALFPHIGCWSIWILTKCILINPSYVLAQASLVDYKFCLASSVVTYSATYISVDVSAWHPLWWIFLFRWL